MAGCRRGTMAAWYMASPLPFNETAGSEEQA
jgi:hypothetical protein